MITKINFKENHKFKNQLTLDLSNEDVLFKVKFKDKLKSYGIIYYTVNNGIININKSVNLSSKNLTEIPFKFGIVKGYFDCSYNNLTSLQGAPTTVGGDFYCNNNNLTSLQGAPTTVEGDFYCSYNPKLLETYGSKEAIIEYVKANCEVGGEIYV